MSSDSERSFDCSLLLPDTCHEWIEALLYGPCSLFTQEEQDAMLVGYTIKERLEESGWVFGGIFPQAISDEHARKLAYVAFVETLLWIATNLHARHSTEPDPPG